MGILGVHAAAGPGLAILTSSLRLKWRSGLVAGRAIPWHCAIRLSENSASAGWRSHGACSISPRTSLPVDPPRRGRIGRSGTTRATRGSTGRRPLWRGSAPRSRPASPPMGAAAAVGDPLPLLDRHRGAEIWQMEPGARGGDCERARRVEAQEPNPRFVGIGRSALAHIGAHVELEKRRRPRDRRQAAQPNPTHPEGHDSEPCLAAMEVELELRRNPGTQTFRGDRPVGEQ